MPLANRCFECSRRAGWGDMPGLRASAARCKLHRLPTDVYVLRARCEFLQGCSRKPSFGVSLSPPPSLVPAFLPRLALVGAPLKC